MALLTLRNLHLSYGDPPLIDGIDLAVEAGERICLLGRNGEGKSTLLRLIAGELHADDGERVVAQGVRIARLTQEIPEQLHGSVFEVVADGAGERVTCVQQTVADEPPVLAAPRPRKADLQRGAQQRTLRPEQKLP